MNDEQQVNESNGSPRFRVEATGGGCEHCGQGHLWTVYWEVDGEEHESGQSWLDKEADDDVCEFMNLAYGYGLAESKRKV